ncbi:MAG: hypothetical protein WB729_02825 [Candidatus Sulfotelmatobacter sp.]
MSVDVLRTPNLGTIASAVDAREIPPFSKVPEWSPEWFAHEQLRGLVRQVFFSSVAQPVRQVLFTAVEGRTDVTQLCRQVGETLASEIKGSVAVLSRDLTRVENQQEEIKPEDTRSRAIDAGPLPLRDVARRVSSNLWLLSEVAESRTQALGNTALYSRLCELRTEFDYSIVEGSPAGLSSEAASLGRLTDGIVLVLTAHKTRRAAAKSIKESLEAARTRVLGMVLSERIFPIPGALYRRL